MCCYSVTSPILSFKKIVLYAFLNIKSTDIHFKLFTVWLYPVSPARMLTLIISCGYVYIIYCMKHILIIFILVTEYLFKKKRQSFTFLVVTILSPLVFLTTLQVCQELQNKFNIVIIINKSHWHLCRKTPPSLHASTTVANLFQKFWWNAL